MPTDDELREIARATAKEKVGFYTHLAAYVIVNLFLIALWWFTSGPGSFPWFLFVTFGWGIGIASHYFGAFHGHAYTERVAEREYRRLKGER
jgi:hypothetical protein